MALAAYLRCPKCGEALLRNQESKRLHEDAIAVYRKKHGLPSANEIRDIREGFGLTQADLARLLRFGANMVSRWESGRNVQTAAMDMLRRLIRDLPGSMSTFAITLLDGPGSEASTPKRGSITRSATS